MSRQLILSASAIIFLGSCSISEDCSIEDCNDEKSFIEGSSEEVSRSAVPQGNDALTRAIAQRLPQTANKLFVARNWKQILTWYPAFRDRIGEHFVEIRQLEAEIRNTFQIDLRDPNSLERVGIAADGGFGITQIGDEAVYITFLSQPELFKAQIQVSFAGQPFDLPEMELIEQDQYEIRVFRRQAQADPRLIVVTNENMAFIAESHSDLEASLAWIDMLVASSDESLAESEEFNTTLEMFTEDDFFAYFAEGIEDFDSLPVDSSSYGIFGSENALHFDGIGLSSAEFQTFLSEVPPSSDPEAFAKIMTDQVYCFARSSFDPNSMISLASLILSEDKFADFEETRSQINERLQINLEEEVLSALGNNQIIMATRVRILTLGRAFGRNSLNIPELFSALGIIGAVEVTDRAQLLAVFDQLVELHDNRVSRFEEDGYTVLQFLDPTLDIGNFVLMEDLLLLVPSRQRREVVARIRGSETYDLSHIADQNARNLVTNSGENGFFMDITNIRTGPAGMLLGIQIPEDLQGLFSMSDELVLSSRSVENRIDSDCTIHFTPLSEE